MIDLFKKLEKNEKKEKHPRSIEIFARKKSKCSSRYGTKRPIKNINKHEILLFWRGDV